MVSKAKLYKQLDRLENELKEKLVPHLRMAASGENDFIFCTTDFNTLRRLRGKTDKRTEELIGLGRQILLLKEKLGESSEGSIAERICWYCRKWSNSGSDYQTTMVLAKQFLQEIAVG